MHRRHFMAAAPFVSAAVLSAPAFAQNAFDALPRISWRMSSSFLPQTDVIFDGATLFASVLSDLTSGRFTIDIHPANDLTPIAETFTKAKEGWFELAHTALPLHAADEPVLALMGGVPFGMNARQLDAFLSYAGEMMPSIIYCSIINFMLCLWAQQGRKWAGGFAANCARSMI